MFDEGWVRIGSVQEMSAKNTHVLEQDGEPILIHRTGDEWQAFSLRCPHKGGVMREIDVRDNLLACPLHAWLFELDDGGRERHEYGDLTQFPLQVADDAILIQL